MPQLLKSDELRDYERDNQTGKVDRRNVQRQRLRRYLDTIASEVSAALQDAKLAVPVYFCVPSSGSALLSYCTPGDPSDEDWSRTSEIISRIVGAKIDVGLITRPLACAASGVGVDAAEPIANLV